MRTSFAVRLLRCVAWLAICSTAVVLWAAPRHNPEKALHATVDLFAGIQAGKLDVKFIPKNVNEANLTITNKTDEPLTVALPAAFGGVPVLAQPALPGMPGLNFPGQNRQGPGQGQGNNNNPFSPQQPQTGPNAPQRVGATPEKKHGLFDLAPEQVGHVKVETLCLDHGKPDPRAAIPYQVQPIDQISPKPELRQLLEMLGRGEVSHRAAQLAAWHLVDGLSWEKLAALRERTGAGPLPRYSKKELDAAKKAMAKAVELAGAKPAASKAG